MSALGPQVLVQLSDTHITTPGQRVDGRVDTAAALARAVQTIQRWRPSPAAVLISGDLVESGTAEEYAHLRALLAPLSAPLYVIAGNHDERQALRAAFPEHAHLGPAQREAFIQYAVDLPGAWRLVALDTVVPGASHGALCEQRLAWLQATLEQAPTRPTIVAMHHPPFRTHIAAMDALGLRHGRDAFEAIIRRHPQVQRIVCGHLHRSIQARVAHTVALTAPSPAHQVALNLLDDEPLSYTFEPPGLALHVWTSSTDLVSHVLPLGEFPGPFPY